MTKLKRKSIPGVVVPPLRTVQIGFRVSAEDAGLLAKLAQDAGVGHLTLARLVVEGYLADFREKKSKRAAVKKAAT
jgi:hypothetical protein